jgi:hypothetical protein
MTKVQRLSVEAYLRSYLLFIFPDNHEREEVISLIIDDVVSDIDECADWSDFEEDEIHSGDIEIALARVLLEAVRFNYTGE